MNIGFNIIGDMDKDELIEEVLRHQRKAMNQLEMDTLKAHVIEFRIAETRKRLEAEAGIKVHHGVLGSHVCNDDECQGA